MGFIGHLQVVTTNNYNTIADFYSSQITTAHAEFFPARSVFSRRCLVTAYYNGFSSAQVLFERRFPSNCLFFRTRLRVTLRQAVYRPSVRLGDKPLEDHDHYFYFPTEHLLLWSLCNILFDEKMGLSFAIAAGPRQRSHSHVRLPRDSWPHFTVSDSRLPPPGGPGPRIYISQYQGGPVIPPGTGFPCRRLLRLAGIRWRYSTRLHKGWTTVYSCSNCFPYNPFARSE
jgi:hypothetical protein